jgi:hypothetical protein
MDDLDTLMFHLMSCDTGDKLTSFCARHLHIIVQRAAAVEQSERDKKTVRTEWVCCARCARADVRIDVVS